jgi:hypothetical protein
MDLGTRRPTGHDALRLAASMLLITAVFILLARLLL